MGMLRKMKNLLNQLKQASNNKERLRILRIATYESPLAWRIISIYFQRHIYVSEKELLNFFRYARIKKKYDGDMIRFVEENLDEFKVLNKDRLKPSLLSLERKFLYLQLKFKKTISVKVRYMSYFDVFINADKTDIEWMIHILLGQWEEKTKVNRQMIEEIQEEVNKVEHENDVIVSVSMTNKQTNQIVAMDMIVSKEILNTVMKEKVHKEFDKILKETVNKLSTIKNVNRLLYNEIK